MHKECVVVMEDVAGNKREKVDCCQVTGYLSAFLKINDFFLVAQHRRDAGRGNYKQISIVYF